MLPRDTLPRKTLKNRLSLIPFPAFWCGFLCMEQVTNEKKILRILVKQNLNRKKIARLINISDQTGRAAASPPPASYAYADVVLVRHTE